MTNKSGPGEDGVGNCKRRTASEDEVLAKEMELTYGRLVKFVNFKLNRGSGIDDRSKLIEDLVQETAARACAKFTPGRGPLWPFLEEIATNLIADYYRNSKTRNRIMPMVHLYEPVRSPDTSGEQNTSTYADTAEDPTGQFDDGVLDKIVFEDSLKTLSPDEKQCIRMKYEEDRSTKEITAMTGIAEGTVGSHLSRGKAKLRGFPDDG